MKSNREPMELVLMFRNVKNTYLMQANVILAQIGDVNELVTTNEYGDPIDMNRRRPRHGSQRGETVDFNDDVIDTLKRKFLFGKADLHFVATCQMHGPLGVTPNFKNICYVAHTFLSGNLEGETTTYAHELGHAFGLRHFGHGTDHMMAEGNVIGHKNSFIMTDADIDQINPSGT